VDAALHLKGAASLLGGEGHRDRDRPRVCPRGSQGLHCGRILEAAQAAAAKMENEGGVVTALAVDVAEEIQVEAGVKKVVENHGAIDVLVSNAGIQHIEPIVELSLENWRRVLAVHLDGGFLMARACLRHMAKAGRGGSIIYMGSVHSKEASALKAPYVFAKHGLLGLCKAVAKEGAKYGVRSNIICPGFVRTPLVDKQIPEQAKELGISEEEVIKDIMLKETIDGEFTSSADIAELRVFFASFRSNALTGQSVVVSHGWHMQ
jgi:3-hydroxybutyrate dehydrogenase